MTATFDMINENFRELGVKICSVSLQSFTILSQIFYVQLGQQLLFIITFLIAFNVIEIILIRNATHDIIKVQTYTHKAVATKIF